jgi:hypothetical protein
VLEEETMLWQTFTRQVRWLAAVLWIATWAGVADARATEVGTGGEALGEELAELRRKNVDMQRQLDELRRQLDALRPALARAPLPGVGAAPSSALDEALAGLEPRGTPRRGLTTPAPAAGPFVTPRVRLVDISLSTLVGAGSSSERDEEIELLQAGGHDPRQRGFTLQQAELSLMGAVDPYFLGEAHLVYFLDSEGESQFEVEEAFFTTQSLPHGLQLEGGQFLTEFGRINPLHAHAWHWQDQPVIHSRLFGGDGIRQVGFRLGWLTELPWYSELHFGAQNADGPNMVSFLGSRHEHGAHGEDEHHDEAIGGRPLVSRDVSRLDDLVWLARWYNAWDPADEISTALGLSALFGPNATGDDGFTWIYGADLVVKWRPLHQHRGWPFFIFESELIRRDYVADDFVGEVDGEMVNLRSETLQDWGLYAQGLWGFHRRWAAGLRFEYASGSGASEGGRKNDPFRDNRVRVSPLVSFYPSEFARIRLQYNYDRADHLERRDNAHSVWLGFDFGLGAHPAHTF